MAQACPGGCAAGSAHHDDLPSLGWLRGTRRDLLVGGQLTSAPARPLAVPPAEQGFTKMVDLPGLKSALQKYKYKFGAQLGSGSYGVVWAAVNRETRDRVAIKRIKRSEDGLSDSTVREICALRDLEHHNIVR